MDKHETLRTIGFFSHLGNPDFEILKSRFQTNTAIQGTHILTAGLPVEGLYVLTQGEVLIVPKGGKKSIATISAPGMFGEMSLIQENEHASASVVANSSRVEFLFVEQQVFRELLNSNINISHAFYRGCSELISSRLRSNNATISMQLDAVERVMFEIEQQGILTKFISKTQNDISDTGSNIIGQLLEIVMDLTNAVKEESPDTQYMQSLIDRIEKLCLQESQNFDVISQQLDLVTQFFDNIRRIIHGEIPKEVRGDTRLLERQK